MFGLGCGPNRETAVNSFERHFVIRNDSSADAISCAPIELLAAALVSVSCPIGALKN